jgi:ABC-type transport system involved in multi-copper enzyme maturation permease subunit
MGPAGQQVGWFGRTFGWENTPAAWLTRLGAVGWLAGLWLILSYTKHLATGEIILALIAWFLVLAVAARRSVRDMFGPVFFYEVVRVGRRRSTFAVRFLYALLVAALLVMMYLSWLEDNGYFNAARRAQLIQTNELSKFASAFFETFVVVQYLTVMLLTPVYVGGAIAVEKERKTLEFLLATDLRNREIVFGKLAARVTNLLMFVFAGLPIVAFLQLFGGIDPNLLLAAFAATFINVIGLSAVAVFMSTMLRRSRDAILLTYMLAALYVIGSMVLAFFAIAPPFAGAWWTLPIPVLGFSLSDIMLDVASGNPVWTVIRVEMQGRRNGPPGQAGDIGGIFRDFATFWTIVAVAAIGVAVLRLRVVALTQSYGPVKQPRPRTAGTRVARRYPTIGTNPVFWREVFVEGGTRGGWIGRVVNVVIGLLVFMWIPIIVYFVFFDVRGFRPPMNWAETWHEFTGAINSWARVTTGVMTTLMFFAVTVRAAGAISGEKDKDTWISLVGTPLSADSMLWGKWWGCVLGLRKAYLVLFAVWAIALSIGAIHPMTVPLELAMVFTLVSAFTWAGLLCSMRARNSMISSVQAFFLALFMSGGFWAVMGFCCCLPFNIVGGRERDIEGLMQTLLGFTPPLMTGFPLFRSGIRRDMEPFQFEPDSHHGLGFASLLLGLAFWVGVNVLLAAICLQKFRRVTNRVPVYLPEELRMRAEYARRARARAAKAAANGAPADAPTVDVKSLPAREQPG